MGRPHEIELLGKRFRLKSGYDPDYLESLAQHVNDQVATVQRRGGTTKPIEAALLAALNIADEFFREKDEHSEQIAKINEKAQKILSWIDDQPGV